MTKKRGTVKIYLRPVVKPVALTAEDIERIGKNATKDGSAINRVPKRFA